VLHVRTAQVLTARVLHGAHGVWGQEDGCYTLQDCCYTLQEDWSYSGVLEV
jgi:hypothetical protein